MNSHVERSSFGQTSETTSANSMFTFDGSGRTSSHYEGVNVNGVYSCPVPTTSAQREEIKTSLRGSTNTLPRPQISMRSSGSPVETSGLGYRRGADREPEKGVKRGGNRSQEGDQNAEGAQSMKRNANIHQRQDSEQRPQIYPWMTKLHMSHGKVCLFYKKMLKSCSLLTHNTWFRLLHCPS